MKLPHTGAWGTWDFGITEGISDLFGLARNDQGGSQLNGTYNAGSTAVYQDPDTGVRGTLEQLYPKSPTTTTNTGGNTGGGSGGGSTGGSTGGFDRFDRNANPGEGWGWHGPDGGWKPNSPSGSGSSVNLDELYAPIFNALNQQRDLANTFYSQGQSQVESQRASQQQRLGENKLITDAKLAEQGKILNQDLESALAQAVRSYNALSQRGNVLYGQSSSAGRAMGELAAREAYRQQGGIRQENQRQLGNLANSVKETELYYAQTAREIDEEAQQRFTELWKEWKSQMDYINMKFAENETAKRAYKTELDNSINMMQREYEFNRKAKLDELNIWKQQQDYMLQQELGTVAKNLYSKPPDVFGGYKNNLAFSSDAPTASKAMVKKMTNRDEDEFSSLWA